MDNRLLRLAYAVEFMAALVAVFLVWSYVAGQGHVDLVPWHWKLMLGLAGALAAVEATRAAVSHARAWNHRTLRWLAVLLSVAVGCGLISYYAHLYWEERPEEAIEEEEAQGGAGLRPAAGLQTRAARVGLAKTRSPDGYVSGM